MIRYRVYEPERRKQLHLEGQRRSVEVFLDVDDPDQGSTIVIEGEPAVVRIVSRRVKAAQGYGGITLHRGQTFAIDIQAAMAGDLADLAPELLEGQEILDAIDPDEW